jgi:hypothetical protein
MNVNWQWRTRVMASSQGALKTGRASRWPHAAETLGPKLKAGEEARKMRGCASRPRWVPFHALGEKAAKGFARFSLPRESRHS